MLEVSVLNVGQGLSVLIEDDGHFMLYDGGGKDTSSYVVSYLKQKGITTLDYIVASHYDEDHISGLIGAIYAIGCDTLLLPDYESDTDIYKSFEKARDTSDATVIFPRQGDTFSLGNATIMVVGPSYYDNAKENNRSLSIKVEDIYGSCLLCGDSESAEEYDILDSGLNIKSDIYIVNHHGSASSSVDEFVEAVDPVCSIISCGNNNTYGHPAGEALNCLSKSNTAMFRTDIQGEIVLICEEAGISSNQIPCEDWTPGDVFEETTKNNDFTNTTDIQYVCNENTKKFHYTDCDSVNKMKEKNKRYTTLTRDELIAQGYDPCGNCHP